jgi:hypothetical protein
MKLEDIRNTITRKCVQNLGIDIEPFETTEELRTYIKLNHARLYQQKNMNYYLEYNRKRYAAARNGQVRKYTRRQQPTTTVESDK